MTKKQQTQANQANDEAKTEDLEETTSHEPVEQPEPASADELPEISPALEAQLNDDGDTEPDKEPGEKNPKQELISHKDQVRAAADSAAGLMAMVVKTSKALGFDLHTDDEAIASWADDVAPCMVKYGFSPSTHASKYADEIKALSATAMLGLGMYAGYKQSTQPTENEGGQNA